MAKEKIEKIVRPRVSDHAVIRYMERVMGLDIESIRKEMMTPAREAMIDAGAKKIMAGEFVYIIEEKAIVTILFKNPKHGDRGLF